MMKPQGKKLAALILEGKHENEEELEDMPSPSSEGQQAAASDVIAAIESGDAKSLAAALSDFVSMCHD